MTALAFEDNKKFFQCDMSKKWYPRTSFTEIEVIGMSGVYKVCKERITCFMWPDGKYRFMNPDSETSKAFANGRLAKTAIEELQEALEAA